MQCPHCTMTIPMVTEICPYCGQKLTQQQAQKSLNLRAFGLSMLFDTGLMLSASVLVLAQRTSDGEVFRLLTTISKPSDEWPTAWTALSYGYLMVGLLAFLCSVSCLITQARLWAVGALLCGLAGSAMLATFGLGVLLNTADYSSGLGFWLGLAGSFTLTTTSMLFQVLSKK